MKKNHSKRYYAYRNYGSGSLCSVCIFANSNTNGNRQHSTAYGECNVPVIWYASGSNTGRTCGWDRFYVF